MGANYGLARGTPVDRVYIERFLAAHADLVRGRVLEVKNADYTWRFGRGRVTTSDVVDIDASNEQASVVADLGVEQSLPSEQFDCIILTQTLQLIVDVGGTLANCYQALRPGGTLLITVPSVSIWVEEIHDLWRWTPAGFEVELDRRLPADTFSVRGFGTLPATIGFLHGMAAQELTAQDFDPYDPRFPLVVGAVVRKSAGK